LAQDKADLKIAFGRPLLSEPLFAGRTTVSRSERLFICKTGGSFVGGAGRKRPASRDIASKHPQCASPWPQPL